MPQFVILSDSNHKLNVFHVRQLTEVAHILFNARHELIISIDAQGTHSGSTFTQALCDALKLKYDDATNTDEERNKRYLDQLFIEFVIPIVGSEAIKVKYRSGDVRI